MANPGELIGNAKFLELSVPPHFGEILGISGAPGTGPVVQNVSPLSGAELTDQQPWSAQVISPVGRPFAVILLLVQYPLLGMYDVIYDGSNVASSYFCNVAPVAGGFGFTNVLRRGGWPATDIRLLFVAVDAAGMVNS